MSAQLADLGDSEPVLAMAAIRPNELAGTARCCLPASMAEDFRILYLRKVRLFVVGMWWIAEQAGAEASSPAAPAPGRKQMEALEADRLAQLGEEIRDADAQMSQLTHRIARYRKERGLPLLVERRGVNAADATLQQLETEFGHARQRFYSLLNERAQILKPR